MDKGLTERMELPGELFEAVGPYLARQRWYAGEGPPVSMNVVEARVLAELKDGPSRLLWAVVEAEGAD